jgi:hypothetical protein
VDETTAPGRLARKAREGLELTLHLGDGAGDETATATRDEPVTLRLVLRNGGTAAHRIQYSSARTYDVSVLAPDGRELWRWSHGRMFAQMISDVALDPDESREFRVTWDQRTNDGATVPPGRYEAVGSIPAIGGEIHSAPLPFTIK